MGLTSAGTLPHNNSEQVVHSDMPLSLSSISLYWSDGSDAVQQGR